MRRTVLVTYNQRTGSQHMRGWAVYDALKRAGRDVHIVTNDNLKDAPIDRSSTVIIVKTIISETIAHCKKRGAYMVYDIIDNWNWKTLTMGWNAIIASNNEHAKFMAKHHKGKIVTIPHLHTNVSRKRISNTDIKTIGYIGMDKQFALTKEMQTFCAKSGLQWHQSAGGDPVQTETETLKLDLGLIYATSAMSELGLNFEYVMKYKPATKLTNYFSYGVPALFNPTVAFMEVVDQDPKLKYLVVNSPGEMYNKINELRAKPEIYKDLSDRCFALAERYHLDNAPKYYDLLTTKS